MMLFFVVVQIRLKIKALQKKVSYKFVWNKSILSSQFILSLVSDCRENAQDAGSADSLADQIANQFGRNGGNCQTEYLCKVQCKYNPQDKTCQKSNCP
jgi:hypothetical protein